MTRSDQEYIRRLGSLGLVLGVWMLATAVSTPVLAQTICNSRIIINYPNGDEQHRVVGDTLRVALTITNGPSQDAGQDDDQSFTLVDFFPSCLSVTGAVCTPDEGVTPGAPPPIQYAGSLASFDCPSLPVANDSNPFNIQFSVAPPFNFANGAGCSFSFDVLITEIGTSPNRGHISQLASTNGVCGSSLTSSSVGTAEVTLTCPVCDDGNPCNGLETCDPETALCVPGTPVSCSDYNACTDDSCDPASGCVNAPKPPDFCDDGDQCTEDVCDPVDGCTSKPADPLPPGCGEAICRTPGFWATHAGVEKKNSVNIAEAVIDCVDGNCATHTANDFLLICGEKIDSPDSNPADGTTDWNDAASSTEAMCVSVQGDSRLQLARQLTAAALNCIISGGGSDCGGTGIYSTVFGDCNDVCIDTSATQSEITACIRELDCLNNGNNFANGACSPGGPTNCHQRDLVNEGLGLDFEPPGPAGSSNACNAANGTPCTVIAAGESSCGTDSLP